MDQPSQRCRPVIGSAATAACSVLDAQPPASATTAASKANRSSFVSTLTCGYRYGEGAVRPGAPDSGACAAPLSPPKGSGHHRTLFTKRARASFHSRVPHRHPSDPVRGLHRPPPCRLQRAPWISVAHDPGSGEHARRPDAQRAPGCPAPPSPPGYRRDAGLVTLDTAECWARLMASTHGVLGTVHPERVWMPSRSCTP